MCRWIPQRWTPACRTGFRGTGVQPVGSRVSAPIGASLVVESWAGSPCHAWAESPCHELNTRLRVQCPRRTSFLFARGCVGMCARVDVGLTRSAARTFVWRSLQANQVLELGLRFDVEPADAASIPAIISSSVFPRLRRRSSCDRRRRAMRGAARRRTRRRIRRRAVRAFYRDEMLDMISLNSTGSDPAARMPRMRSYDRRASPRNRRTPAFDPRAISGIGTIRSQRSGLIVK